MAKKKEKIKIGSNDALIIVDLQNDFCSGGTLAVPSGDKIVPVVNRLIEKFIDATGRWCSNLKIVDNVVFTKDWHPPKHCSFKLWPIHCVQGTQGAEFHPGLFVPNKNTLFLKKVVFYKGYKPRKDSYSGFDGIAEEMLGNLAVRGIDLSNPKLTLNGHLTWNSIIRIFVAGLATDHCVRATALDGLKLGFEVYVITDAIAAVNVNSGDGERAFVEMADDGVRFCESKDIISPKD